MTAALALPRFWREGVIAALALIAALQWVNARHWHKRYDREHETRLQITADFKAFANGVKEKAEEIVRRVNQRNQRLAEQYRTAERKNDAEIRRRIDAAVAAVRLRASQGGTDTRGSGNAATAAPSASSGTSGAGATAVVDVTDLEICSANTVKAQGWQEWWRQVSQVPR